MDYNFHVLQVRDGYTRGAFEEVFGATACAGILQLSDDIQIDGKPT